MKKQFLKINWLCLIGLILISNSSIAVESNPIQLVMQRIINKVYANKQIDLFNQASQDFIVESLDVNSLDILANDYWSFTVNTDVEVLVCRDVNQKEVPFWLVNNDFIKTADFIKNENVNYEVWRKVFNKGKVNLGINGFDRHRYVYFVAIKPINEKVPLKVTPIWPMDQKVMPLQVGSYIYKDWDELTITSFSSVFANSYILPTYRGRSREAHLIGAFRSTDYPSTRSPDQILLSWTEDPRTTQNISWRTNLIPISSKMKYWSMGSRDTLIEEVVVKPLSDMLLYNDPLVKRANVSLTNLKPNTVYNYQIVSNSGTSKVYTFKTAPLRDDAFEFGWFGDMHNDLALGDIIPNWKSKYPNASFYLQAGDLVNTGLYRDQWDQLLHVVQPITDQKPFMTIPGNHDSQEALFPSMYLSYLKFPANGPSNLPKGLSYHFSYANTLFLMIDAVTLGVEDQKQWIANTLKNSKEKFKVVVFHFAPHTFESTYPDIIAEWESIFKTYDVDLVFNGHFHYYHKTAEDVKPKYVMSIATKSKGENIEVKEGEFYVQKGYLYQHVKVNSNTLELISVDRDGNIIDQFKLTKN